MTAIARQGLDLNIERDGQWVYAGFGWPKGDNHDSALVEYMDEGEKTCLVYLPLWDEVLSLELGIDGDSRIETVPNPFRHRIVVLGSSITHGASAGRPGMTWTARLRPPDGTRFPAISVTAGNASCNPNSRGCWPRWMPTPLFSTPSPTRAPGD